MIAAETSRKLFNSCNNPKMPCFSYPWKKLSEYSNKDFEKIYKPKIYIMFFLSTSISGWKYTEIMSKIYTRIERNIRIMSEWIRRCPACCFAFAISLTMNADRPESGIKVSKNIRVYT